MTKNRKKNGGNGNQSAGKTKKENGENTKRIRMLREIGELVLIPEIEEIIATALKKAKKKYEEKIAGFKNIKRDLEKEFLEKKEDGKAMSKSFYFELTRVEDSNAESGHKWELGQFKLESFRDMVDVIFSKLIDKTDTFKIAPNLVQVETVYSLPLDKWFQFNFTKNSESRVVGFVKIIDEQFVIKENNAMLTVNTRTYQNLQKEKVMQLMEENPHFCEYISFYAGLIQQTTKNATI